MDITKKKIIFFVLMFLLFYVFVKSCDLLEVHLHLNKDIIIFLLGFMYIGIMFLLIKMTNIKDSFFFELTPEKKCDGGPYMYSSDPEKQKLCSQFSQEDLSKYSCCPGFHGRPVWFERSDESNKDWANTMCDNGFNNDYPKVL